MPALVLLREPDETGIAEQLRADLVLRDWAVTVDVHASRSAVQGDRPIVSLLPDNDSPAAQALRRHVDAGADPILVVRRGQQLPDWVHNKGCRGTVMQGHVGYERLFEDLYRLLLGPLPPWLDLRLRPSHLLAPTGVAWWNEDVYVADDKYDHVARIGTTESAIVLPGLNEPHHLHLDRRTLTVSNKAADELLVVQLVDGLASNVTPLTEASGPVRRPHAAQLSLFGAAVADTDHHRVLVSWEPGENPRQIAWTQVSTRVPLNAPCGVQMDGDMLWIADTFNHRIVAVHRRDGEIGDFGSYGDGNSRFRFPVGIASWRDLIFVADENGKRLHAYAWSRADDGSLLVRTITTSLGAPFIRQPFGLSVNRESRLAVADRSQRCVWLVDLEDAPLGEPG